MSTAEHTEAAVGTAAAASARRRRRRRGGSNWWRHAVAILFMLWALFPVAYVVSAAFSADQTLTGASLIPRAVTLDNFREIFSTEVEAGEPTANYARWYVNSLIVPGSAAFFSVFLGALAAYAFSRFRFRGRRMGMLSLLLIQMFPSTLLFVALYLIILNTGEVFGAIGLNTLTALILVYLGGAMGVNTWLMKGFFDTIPTELDESARVDGATPAQIFWGVILPLSAPVLAVIALITWIFTLNEFVIASALLETSDKFTLILGLQAFIDDEYSRQWGPFAAGVLLAAIPPALLFLALQRFIVEGLTSGAVKG